MDSRPRVVDPEPPIFLTLPRPDCGCPRKQVPRLAQETIAHAWESLQPEGKPIKFATFIEHLVVHDEPGYDLDTGVDHLIELFRPHDLNFAEFKEECVRGVLPQSCLCAECLVFRGALTRKKLRSGKILQLGDITRAFIMPCDVDLVTLSIDGHKVWSLKPDATGRVSLPPQLMIPLLGLWQCEHIVLEPPCEQIEVEYISLRDASRSKIFTMDLGVYEQFKPRTAALVE